MKRAYRLRALDALYVDLRSDDFDRREHALFQLALLLRRSHPAASHAGQPAYVDDNLPRDLLRLRLSTEEKRQAAEQLAQVIKARPPSRATAIWALGELEAAYALASLLACIAEIGEQLSTEAAYQACEALAGWLSMPGAALADESLADLRALLQGWAGSTVTRLAKRAQELLAQLSAP